ncbi:DUF1996 domain-containing protein [Streptomyces sp. AK010]|uniref:DUF1996 domain-containing protein n=1 Tax=Streptomyces sp. AK010 TaxID=2723074 RepID=UPI001615D3C7|nr:DUF1996 domain-containing protein [Streptomyces sp. AK010]MBB6421527.1 hypothetical protein [Streptomyces sp. AK010]
MAANVYASATDGGSGGDSAETRSGTGVRTAGATIDCPDVGSKLTSVPEQARGEVDKELALLDEQIAKAYQRLSESAQQVQQDPGFADNAVVNPLKEKRAATLERIAIAIDRVGDRPEGLEALAACTVEDGNEAPAQGEGQDGGDEQPAEEQGQAGQGQGANGGQAGNGPVAADFADIKSVQPNANDKGAVSGGSFATSCGVNENGLFNSDNIIAAPGVTNGAHHFHDYVGNQSNNAFASDQDLAKAETSCADQGDKSSYYWPVVRLQNGAQEQDAQKPGGGIEGNAGEIVTPKQVTLTFLGNPREKVTAMPRLLRIITGDAKSFVNGPANANASWSCTGFEDRQLKDKYPLCPQGSDVVRTFRFQSCWDGRNIDSANHRTHVAFADAAGNCPSGFRPIPQLVQRIVYDIDAPSLQDGGRTTPLFAVDSFPEQLHKPVTDHGDFINIFDEDLMGEMVDCINDGRKCGAGADGGQDPAPGEEPQEEPTKKPEAPQEEPTKTPEAPQEEPTKAPAAPQEEPTRTPDAPQNGNGGGKPGDQGDDGDDGKGGAAKPPADEPDPEPEPGDASTAPGGAQPEVKATASADGGNAAEQGGGSKDGDDEDADGLGDSQAVGQATSAAPTPSVPSRTEPQAVGQGGLADTGAQLWPAAAGAVLVIAGFVVLRRVRRSHM